MKDKIISDLNNLVNYKLNKIDNSYELIERINFLIKSLNNNFYFDIKDNDIVLTITFDGLNEVNEFETYTLMVSKDMKEFVFIGREIRKYTLCDLSVINSYFFNDVLREMTIKVLYKVK